MSEAAIQNLLGPPDEGDWAAVLGSIGHNGLVVVDFGGRLVEDGPGPDLLFWVGGFADADEMIEGFRVEGSLDGQSFEYIAEISLQGRIPPPIPLTAMQLDMQGKSPFRQLRITDIGTDPEYGGLELNAIEAKCTSSGE